jgi:hypothetical protein
MTQEKIDQDTVNEMVNVLVRRFGFRRIVVGLHKFASQQTPQLWDETLQQLEDMESHLNLMIDQKV